MGGLLAAPEPFQDLLRLLCGGLRRERAAARASGYLHDRALRWLPWPRERRSLQAVAELPAVTAGQVIPDEHRVDVRAWKVEGQEKHEERGRLDVGLAKLGLVDL